MEYLPYKYRLRAEAVWLGEEKSLGGYDSSLSISKAELQEIREGKEDSLAGSVVTGQEENCFKLKEERFGPDIRKKFFYNKSSEALEQAAHRCGGCPVPGAIQGQAGRGSEHFGLAVGVPFHSRRAGL